MTRITIDDNLKKQFAAADGLIELCDESGKLIMQVTVGHKPVPEDWVPITPELNEKELNRLAKYDGPGITTEELIARLRGKGDKE